MKLRISLRNFLLLVLIVGTALGLWGRYVYRDFRVSTPRILSDKTTAVAHFRSFRRSVPPDFIVLSPRYFPAAPLVDIRLNASPPSPRPHQRKGESYIFNDQIRVLRTGELLFNHDPIPVRSGTRVFFYTAEGKLEPLAIDDDLLLDIRRDNLTQFAQTPVYQQHIAARVAYEVKKSQCLSRMKDLLPLLAIKDAQKDHGPPEKLTVPCHDSLRRIDTRTVGGGAHTIFTTELYSVLDDELNGQYLHGGANLSVRADRRIFDQSLTDKLSYTTSYAGLHTEGMILPIAGGVYQVTAVGKSSGRNVPTGMHLELVPPERLPPHAEYPLDDLLLPLEGSLNVVGTELHLIAIQESTSPPGLVATVSPPRMPNKQFTLRVGERLTLGNLELEVTNIVPKSAEHNSLGWLTLAPVLE